MGTALRAGLMETRSGPQVMRSNSAVSIDNREPTMLVAPALRPGNADGRTAVGVMRYCRRKPETRIDGGRSV